jgi:hypothetical protein
MKNIAIALIINFLFINSCTQKPTPDYNYRIDLSKYELKLIKQYIRKYGNLNNEIIINGNYLYSDNMDLLKIIKIRIEGMTPRYYPVSITIKHENNYYSVHKNTNINKLNWLNDIELYNNIPKNSMSILKINYPDEMLNLSKEVFMKNYLKQENDNIYSLNAKDNLSKYVLTLSETKYDFMLKVIDNSIKVIDVKVEKINNR